MNRKQFFVALFAVAALLAAGDYYFLHILFPVKKAAMLEKLNRAVNEHLTEPRETAAPGGPAAGDGTTASSFVSALKTCFGESAGETSPDALLLRLAPMITDHETGIENWHIRRPDGREERLMLLTEGSRREVRLFGVDAENLPVPKPLDAKIAVNPSAETLEALKLPGDVVYHQTQETLKFRDGTSAKVERVNDRVHDVQIFLKDQTLSCRDLECQCR